MQLQRIGYVLVLGVLSMAAPMAMAEVDAEVVVDTASPLMVPMRWMHIVPVVLMVGGAYFFRFVYLPAAKEHLEGEAFEALRVSVMERWYTVMKACMVPIIISGFVYYLKVGRVEHDGEALYHALFGVKFILAMVVFTLVSIVYGKKQRLGDKGPMVGAITIGLAVVVIVVAGYMRMM